MRKLHGEAAIAHARQTGAQLYYRDAPVDLATAAQELLAQDPGGLSCEITIEEVHAALEAHQQDDFRKSHLLDVQRVMQSLEELVGDSTIPLPVQAPTYRRGSDGAGPYITCLRCHSTSRHPRDFSEKYCGRCHRFHEGP